MTKLNCILFDLDGTLINTYDLVTKSFQHTVRKHFNKEISAEELMPYFGEPLWVTLERFSKEESEELLKTYRDFNLHHHDDLTTIFPGTEETLAGLKDKGVIIGVVTSKIRSFAIRGIELFNLDKYVDHCIALEDCENHKPHPEPVLRALEALGASREGAMMVGDSPFDIQCARNAGILSAGVSWSILPQEKLLEEKPDIILNTFTDLLKYV